MRSDSPIAAKEIGVNSIKLLGSLLKNRKSVEQKYKHNGISIYKLYKCKFFEASFGLEPQDVFE